ncbi:CD209 antigen-like protein D [Hyposmocoma kahamanoa]|uniref:CD209 antigen-like protein D n=1 Tax=Hyposmocoma kahamanoa TaxID=1477025 RepID=UPI000E6D8080|nr:CD209 antigen-like protein D [Hyposmocoma kahamanoa]
MRLAAPFALVVATCFGLDSAVYNGFENGFEYRIEHVAQSWDAAKASCMQDNASLAVPKTEAEFKFIQSLVRSMMFNDIVHADYKFLVWLGIENRHDCATWITVDGEPLQNFYNKWSDGNGISTSHANDPRCAGMDGINPGLRDWWCEKAQPFVCQRQQATFVLI